jgi:hypothetical protein
MEVAPSTEHRNMEDGKIGCNESVQFGCYEPGERSVAEYDIGSDLGLVAEVVEKSFTNQRLDDDTYFKIVETLHKNQEGFFPHVLHHYKTSHLPLCLFLSGGAGCGTTVVTYALHQALVRHFNSSSGSNADDLKVLLSASTGNASF